MDVVRNSLSNAAMANSNNSDVGGSLSSSMNKLDKGGDWSQAAQMYPSTYFGAHAGSHGYQHPPTTNSSASFKTFISRQNDWSMHASSVYSSMASGSLAGMPMLHPETAQAIGSSFDPGALGLVACRKSEGQQESDSRPQSVSHVSTASDTNAWNIPHDETGDSDRMSPSLMNDDSMSKSTGKHGNYTCKSCGECFDKRDQMRAHRRLVHSLGNHPCTFCDKVFSHRSHLQQHVRIHTGEKLYKCQICFKEFIHSGSLSNHMKGCRKGVVRSPKARRTLPLRVKIPNNSPGQCHVNDANKAPHEKMMSTEVNTSGNARTDSESDTKESASDTGTGKGSDEPRRQPFVCHCGKKFACFAKLELHERTHTGEKPYACEVCDRAFAEKGNLLKHKRIHTRETPYLCRECGELFCHSYQLKRHRIRVHGGDSSKPFHCGVCGRGFLQESKLQLHSRIHTGEKPYICSICEKAFSEKGNLIQHERTHSSLKPFDCDHCDKSFRHASGLRAHCKKRHNLQPSGSICSAKSQSIGVGPNRKMYVDSAVQTYTVVAPTVETYGPCGETTVERPAKYPYDRPHILQGQEPASVDPRYSMVHQETLTSVGYDSRPGSTHSECQTMSRSHDKRSSGSGRDGAMSHKMPTMTSTGVDAGGQSMDRGMDGGRGIMDNIGRGGGGGGGGGGLDSQHGHSHGHDSRGSSMSMRPMDMRALDVRSSNALMHTAMSAGRDAISRNSFLSDLVPSSGVELRNVLAAAQESLNNRGSHGLRLPALPDMMSMGVMDARLAHGVSSDLRCALGQDMTSPGVDSVSFSS